MREGEGEEKLPKEREGGCKRQWLQPGPIVTSVRAVLNDGERFVTDPAGSSVVRSKSRGPPLAKLPASPPPRHSSCPLRFDRINASGEPRRHRWRLPG
ncbi:hypothetical protein MTO96_010546 [Rhipicephalus appendiculatus]